MRALLELLQEQRTRAYLYRVALAVGALLLVYGLVSGEQLAAYVGLAGALLGNATAARNTPLPRRSRGGRRRVTRHG